MKHDWRAQVRKLVGPGKRLDYKTVSERMGMSAGWLSDTLNDKSNPKVSVFIKLAEALGVPPAYLLGDENAAGLTLPIFGVVSGGEGWTPADQSGPIDYATFAIHGEDIIVLDVRGDSMSPVYRNGDQLFCQQRFGAGIHNLMGQDCVIETTDGERFVKILEKGSQRNLYRLKSYNPYFKDIEDVGLKWAAPVIWIRRRG
jgi:transcriptional regulator with XRE-family HTH domain